VNEPGEAQSFVAARMAEGATYLKLVLNGVREVQQGFSNMEEATVAALVKAAHDVGILAVAHIESLEDVRIAVRSGIDGLVHVWRLGGADPEVAQLVADAGVFVVPTLSVPDGFVHSEEGSVLADDPALQPLLSERVLALLRRDANGPNLDNIDGHLAAVRSLHEAGVRLLTGTDVPVGTAVHGLSVHREMELLVEAGLTPTEALAAATANAADAFRLGDLGRIEVGRRADLVLVW